MLIFTSTTMTKRNLKYLEILFLISSAILLLLGWTNEIVLLTTMGAVLYLIILVGNFGMTIIEARKYQNDVVKSESEGKWSKLIAELIQGAILISGLGAMLFKSSVFETPGRIIWFGTILIYVVCGFAIQLIIKLPLKMTYGGWRIKYSGKRK